MERPTAPVDPVAEAPADSGEPSAAPILPPGYVDQPIRVGSADLLRSRRKLRAKEERPASAPDEVLQDGPAPADASKREPPADAADRLHRFGGSGAAGLLRHRAASSDDQSQADDVYSRRNVKVLASSLDSHIDSVQRWREQQQSTHAAAMAAIERELAEVECAAPSPAAEIRDPAAPHRAPASSLSDSSSCQSLIENACANSESGKSAPLLPQRFCDAASRQAAAERLSFELLPTVPEPSLEPAAGSAAAALLDELARMEEECERMSARLGQAVEIESALSRAEALGQAPADPHKSRAGAGTGDAASDAGGGAGAGRAGSESPPMQCSRSAGHFG